MILHSTLSPLTPSSPLYPDGLVTPLWITKHQARLPSAFVSFFTLGTNADTSSLQDNKLKAELNNIRNVLTSTNYKTKLVIVLLGDGSISPVELEERLSTIRRTTGLDVRSLYFLPQGSSQIEIVEFVRTLLSNLRPSCIEYYRDLSKHARRKRNRNATPLPTVKPTLGTSQVLSAQGWLVRYEFKLGVFAEFRQEMDAACRNYETAYESLMSPEVSEAVAAWSPRFNEGRMLADVLAIRIIRALLWMEQHTSAVQCWSSHQDRMHDLIDRRGKGTDTYGWAAWQSIWARVMADLISRSQALTLAAENSTLASTLIFAGPEKVLPASDRITPWEQLQHEGYWLSLASKHISTRRMRALRIPEEDRASPGNSPASVIASKAHMYDTYLAMEPYNEYPADDRPGYDYSGEITTSLQAALEHFSRRAQHHMVERLQLEMALESIRVGAWTEAVLTLHGLWKSQTWRKTGWWSLMQDVAWALLECAQHVQDKALVASIRSELTTTIWPDSVDRDRKLSTALQFLSAGDDRPAVALDDTGALLNITSSFAFAAADGNVGEPMDCQLCLKAMPGTHAGPVTFTEVKVVFEGSLKPLHLVHADQETVSQQIGTAEILDIQLQESSLATLQQAKRSSIGQIASLQGYADLRLCPGQTKIYRLKLAPRDAGEVSVDSVTIMSESEGCDLTRTVKDLAASPGQWWEVKHGKPVARAFGMERDVTVANILPKPPKFEVDIPGLLQAYYINERIELALVFKNGEDEPVTASVQARLISPDEHTARVVWADGASEGKSEAASERHQLPSQQLGIMAAGNQSNLSVVISGTVQAFDYGFEVLVTYTLESDPDTLLSKVFTVSLPIVRPFEANYDFGPRLHPELWPGFFEAPTSTRNASTAIGLKQLYSVTSNIYSFALEPLKIEAILLTCQKVIGGAICSSTTGILQKNHRLTSKSEEDEISTRIEPDQTQTFDFELTVQKLALGDHHTVAIDLALEIGWRREGSSTVNTSVLEVPNFIAPLAEPRVLLTVSKDKTHEQLYLYSFAIENPSMHFLTFNMTMESSEDFAFSGSKATSVSMVPVSRYDLKYRILPNKRGQWIRVNLTVVDAYFGQTLRVQPAGEGTKVDKKGNVLVWID